MVLRSSQAHGWPSLCKGATKTKKFRHILPRLLFLYTFTLHSDPSAAQHRLCMRLSCSLHNGSEVVRRVDKVRLLLLCDTRMTHDGVYKHGVYRCQTMWALYCFILFLRRPIFFIFFSVKNRFTLGVSSLSESLSVCSSDASSSFRFIDGKLGVAEKKV